MDVPWPLEMAQLWGAQSLSENTLRPQCPLGHLRESPASPYTQTVAGRSPQCLSGYLSPQAVSFAGRQLILHLRALV